MFTADEIAKAIKDYKLVQKNLKTVRLALAECESEGSRFLLDDTQLSDLGATYMNLKTAQDLLEKEGYRIWMAYREFFENNPIDFTA